MGRGDQGMVVQTNGMPIAGLCQPHPPRAHALRRLTPPGRESFSCNARGLLTLRFGVPTPRIRLLSGKVHPDSRENLVVHRTNRPRATKNENAEFAKADSAFLRT